MPTKTAKLACRISIDIQHAIVIVPQQPKPIVSHDLGNASRLDPVIDLFPNGILIFQCARHLMKGNPGPVEGICNLRNGTGRAVSQPFTGHFGSAA